MNLGTGFSRRHPRSVILIRVLVAAWLLGLTGILLAYGYWGWALLPLAGAPAATGTHPIAIAQASVESGTYLYVVNLGSNSVSVFQVNLTTGALVEIPGSPFAAGAGPTSAAVQYPPE